MSLGSIRDKINGFDKYVFTSLANSLVAKSAIQVEDINGEIAKRLALAPNIIEAKINEARKAASKKIKIIDVKRTNQVIKEAVDTVRKIFSEEKILGKLCDQGLELARRLAERIVGENIFAQRSELAKKGLKEDQSKAKANKGFAGKFSWLFNNQSIIKHIDKALGKKDKTFEILRPLSERHPEMFIAKA